MGLGDILGIVGTVVGGPAGGAVGAAVGGAADGSGVTSTGSGGSGSTTNKSSASATQTAANTITPTVTKIGSTFNIQNAGMETPPWIQSPVNFVSTAAKGINWILWGGIAVGVLLLFWLFDCPCHSDGGK